MNVLYASDENYIRHAAASMVTLCEHTPDETPLTVHLLSMGVTEASVARLHELVGGYGRTLAVHELGDLSRWFDFSVNPRGFTMSALARLFLARVLPQEVTRVLYLDCDTVVLDDLTPLWDTDLGGRVLGMVAEPTVNHARKKYLGMAEDAPYYNSGVLLIDLQAWRAQHTEQTVLDYYRAMGGDLVAPDQDALNGALPQGIYSLPPKYNFVSVQLYYPYGAQKKMCAPTPFYACEADYRAAAYPPAIVHFLGEERPWRRGNRHPYRNAYLQALAKTPWKDAPLEDGFETYFKCFALFNTLTKPFPMLRWHVIDALIPAFMRHRQKQREKA